MRRTSVSLVSLFGAVVIALAAFLAYRSKISRAASQTAAPCCNTVAPRELDFPYWSLQGGFVSTLNLVSDSPQPIPLTIAIHDDAGDSVFSTATIQPEQKLALDLRTLIVNAGRDPSVFNEGSVAVYYTGTIMPVVGQITLINSQLHLANESEMVENDPGRSDIPAVLDGLWWGLAGGRDARIVVSNMGGQIATADVFLDFEGQSHKAAPITVPAFGTTTLSIAELLNDLGYSPSQVPAGGITIIQRGTNPTLIAQGQVLGPASGFSSTLEFPDPARQEANALDATGLPVGTPSAGSPYFGAGYFTPHVIARNLTSQPEFVTVTVEYPKSSFWNSANWPGGPANPMVRYAGPLKKGQKDPNAAFENKPNPDPSTLTGQFTVASLPVAPYSTVDYPINATLPAGVPFCSIRIQYSGPPGSVIAQAASVNSAGDLVVDAHMAPPRRGGRRLVGFRREPVALGRLDRLGFVPDE